MSNTLDAVLATVAEYAQTHPRSRTARRGVQRCKEFERIDQLPRRDWGNESIAQLVIALTAILKTPAGEETLRGTQAIALYEIAQCRGMVGTIRVGAGKTHISFLAGRVLGARRPLLIVPAKLKRKTKRELLEVSKHWRVCFNLSIISYEWLGTVGAIEYLNQLAPDLIILDEAHKIRNLKASRTRKLRRYIVARSPVVVAMSGTLIRTKLLDWAHISDWALGDGSPAPRRWNTIAHWGNALDFGGKLPPGALSKWGADHREGYRDRVAQTAGVVATTDGLLGVALELETFTIDSPPAVIDAMRLLDNWTLPDGFIITDPLARARACRQVALGVYYRWVEQPPQDWLDKRLAWSQYVRHAVRYLKPGGQPLDSEMHVAQYCANGSLDAADYLAWKEIKKTFRAEVEYVWITDDIVKALIERARKHNAIVWLESVAVGKRMHALGLPYYGAQGMSADRVFIEDTSGPICASIASNSEGRNLQYTWSHAIVSCPMRDAQVWEQMIGRLHREGQPRDEVCVDVFLNCESHRRSWARAHDHAEYLEIVNGQPHKLRQATNVTH